MQDYGSCASQTYSAFLLLNAVSSRVELRSEAPIVDCGSGQLKTISTILPGDFPTLAD